MDNSGQTYTSGDEINQSTSQPVNLLRLRHEFMKAIRGFFYDRGYLEVETPNLVKNSPPDPCIDPLSVHVGTRGPFYLHTSPEIGMKKLLRHGVNRIFQVCKVYRVEEFEEVHSTEFTMLEWYREGTYGEAMEDTASLVEVVAGIPGFETGDRFKAPFPIYDLEDLVRNRTGVNPFAFDREGFFRALELKGFPGIDERDTWNDLFFKLFIQEVEPAMGDEKPYFVKDWPASISTMAKMKDEKKVERFELYARGLEIANGYTELIDREAQRERFERDNLERERLGKEVFAADEGFLKGLAELRGSFAGVSVGVDRLLMALKGTENIDDVLVQRFKP
jgi:elongation factor P--(R)-beta-lysine ligase